MSTQTDFAAVLTAPTFVCPPGLKAWNSSDPAKRFGVYRNNVMVSLIDALADSYPVVQVLVGEAFFRAMAREFVYQSPPRSPVLAWYGSDFPDFIADFPPVAELPYLADVARLEWLRIESWQSADCKPMTERELSGFLVDENQLASTQIVLHPALRLLSSKYPVVSLWSAHQSDEAELSLSAIDLDAAETALLVRPDVGVEIIPIEANAGHFISCLRSGMMLGEAATAGQFDLVAVLALLIRSNSIVSFVSMESA